MELAYRSEMFRNKVLEKCTFSVMLTAIDTAASERTRILTECAGAGLLNRAVTVGVAL
jgi:hypothetical protein